MARLRLIPAIAVFVAATSFAGIQRPTPKVTLELPKTIAPGKVAKGTVVVKIPAGFHAYQNPVHKEYEIPLVIKSGSSNVQVRKAKYPKGIIETFGSGGETAAYMGTIKVPVEFVVVGKPGAAKVGFKVSYQLCDDTSCLPPADLTVTQNVTLKRG